MFIIRKIGFHKDLLLSNNFRRNSDALLELGYVEHVVDCYKLRGKSHSISHGSTLFDDFIRPDVARSQFAFDSKALNAFGW